VIRELRICPQPSPFPLKIAAVISPWGWVIAGSPSSWPASLRWPRQSWHEMTGDWILSDGEECLGLRPHLCEIAHTKKPRAVLSAPDIGPSLAPIQSWSDRVPAPSSSFFELINSCRLVAGRFWLCFGGAFFFVGTSAPLTLHGQTPADGGVLRCDHKQAGNRPRTTTLSPGAAR
jgi:hypothetical protein